MSTAQRQAASWGRREEEGGRRKGKPPIAREGAPMEAMVSGCGSLVADEAGCELQGNRRSNHGFSRIGHGFTQKRKEEEGETADDAEGVPMGARVSGRCRHVADKAGCDLSGGKEE